MKKMIVICIFLGLTVLLSGCLVIPFDGGGINANAVQGTGERVSRDFTVADFTGIDITGAYVVVYRQSNTNAVTVDMQENLFDYLEVYVRNGVLRINSERPFRTNRNNTPRIYIDAPYLENITFNAAINTENWDAIYTRRLNVSVSGAANAVIPMNVEELDVRIAGAADFELIGVATSATLSISGAGDIDAVNLQTQNTTITIAGAGNADIAVSDTLDVTIAGTGRVRYVGNPQVNRSIAGVGSVQRME